MYLSDLDLVKVFSVRMDIQDYNLPLYERENTCYVIFDDISNSVHDSRHIERCVRDYAYQINAFFVELSDLRNFDFQLDFDLWDSIGMKPTTRMNVSFRIPYTGEFIGYNFLQSAGYEKLVDKLMELEGC